MQTSLKTLPRILLSVSNRQTPSLRNFVLGGKSGLVSPMVRRYKSDYSDLTKNVDDVVRQKKVGGQESSQKAVRQIYTGGKYFFFEPEMSILNWKMMTMHEDSEIHNLTVLSGDKVEFHDSTPWFYVLRDQFYLVINDNKTVAVRNFQENEFWPVLAVNQEDQSIDHLLDQKIQINPFKREVMSPFVTNILHEIEKNSDANSQIASETLITIVREAIKTGALDATLREATHSQFLEVLKKKQDFYDKIKQDIYQSYKAKSHKRLKRLYYLIGLQIVFTQWGTYYKYSWDIMEPLTCLFGIVDTFLAYGYWQSTQSEANYEAFEQNYLSKLVEARVGYIENFDTEYEDIKRLIAYVELRKSLDGTRLTDILHAMDVQFTAPE